MTSSTPPGGRRRKRYSGTHPRRFEERYKELDPARWPEMAEHVIASGRTPAGSHLPILVDEILACLDPRPGDVVVDCTLGHGGHALALLERIGPTGRLIGIDQDSGELARTKERLASHLASGRASVHHRSFAGIGKALAESGQESADVVLADLGASSMQLDDPQRGFTFKHEGPLDMRMDARRRNTAADLLRTIDEAELARALRDLADEPDADRIAAAIVRERETRPITTTRELAELVLRAKGLDPLERSRRRATQAHPAARSFQALRILVNDELGQLRELLRVAPHCLRPGGRIAILSFHSGEDRLVKQSFRAGLESGIYARISDEIVRPGPTERRTNPRSRSAKLRWAVRE